MKPRKVFLRKILLLVTLSFVVLIISFLVKNKNKLPKSINVEISKTGVDISINKMHLIEDIEGKKQWELNADKAEVVNSEGITKLSGIQMSFFQKNGNELSVLADSGIIQNKSKNIELAGNVRVHNDEGYTLKTENLNWDPKDKKIKTEDEIEITGTGLNIKGKGMSVDVEKEIFEVYGGVRVRYSETEVASSNPRN